MSASRCSTCGRFIAEATVVGYTDYETGIWEGTGFCRACNTTVDVA